MKIKNIMLYISKKWRRECFCGDEYGLYEQVSDSFCNLPCAGNLSKTCGGDWTNEIHLISYEIKTECLNDSAWKITAIVFGVAFLLLCFGIVCLIKYYKNRLKNIRRTRLQKNLERI